MYFTDEQLENDPELRPRTWRSDTAFQQERLVLFNRLADILHSQADVPPPASDEPSPASPTSTTVAVDPDKTPRSTSSIFSSTLASSITSPTRSVSFFSLPFGSSSRLSVAGSGPVPHTPIVFNSPQTSTFSFETANPSPVKVDSVMGSPIKFRSPSIFSRKHKKNHSASSITRTTSTTSSISIKEGKIFDYIKAATIKKSAKKAGSNKSNASDDNKSIDTDKSNDESTVKDFDKVDSNSGLDSKGKEYVVECLGFGDIGDPQPIEHQYRFVKAQIKKIKERVLGQKVTTTKS
ncbi:unnamed protein product [Aureobasidium mustum]|uniref:Uncharacterized protein n=1 Tax=Aureobasidium mustum TaxID=2773714 RepID=A0A9N8PFX6_9PEZI|nr:unnamed protein product [Aureobasidium mustum]